MPPVTGNYSKGIDGGFLEEQRFAQIAAQKGIPITDADVNRWATTTYFLIRRALGILIGNASPNNGFRIVGDGSSNDFIVQGGDGSLNGAGRIWVEGNQCILQNDVRYVNIGANEPQLSIYPRIGFIIGVGNEILQDTGGSYVPGSLVGRTITPDVTQPAVTATITANTATDITTSIDLTAAGIIPGAFYRIELTTPGANRNDGVYLDVYLDEIDVTEEPNIGHNLGTLIETFRFLRVRQRVFVFESDAVGLPGSFSPLIFFDADGFEHFVLKLADISRFTAQAAINAPDVSDLRFTSGNFTNFLNKTGDNMSGDLVMLTGTNIVLAAGGLVDGRDVSVDGAKLDTINFTAQGVADLLPKISRPFKLADVTGVTAQQTNISQQLRLEEPRGSASQKGVITDTPSNRVLVFNADTGDQFIDAVKNGVNGQLTEVHPFNGFGGNPVLSGTWTFTNASFNVIGDGFGAATTELQVGDIVIGPDGIFLTVTNILNDNAFDTVEPFAGTTAAIATPAARRWLLDLLANVDGTKTAISPGTGTIPSSANLRLFVNKVFDHADQPTLDATFEIDQDQTAGVVPDGSETVKGIVQFAPDLGTNSLEAVQGDDARVGATKAKVGGTTSIHKPTIEFINGTGITISIDDTDADFVKITIINAAPGGGGPVPPSPFNGVMTADTVGGTPGTTTTEFAQGDHSHPLSAQYAIRVNEAQNGSGGTTIGPVPTGFTPRLWISVFVESSGTSSMGVGSGTNASQQGFILSAGAGFDGGVGLIGASVARVTTWTLSQFDNTQAQGTDNGGGNVLASQGAHAVVIGDVLP